MNHSVSTISCDLNELAVLKFVVDSVYVLLLITDMIY